MAMINGDGLNSEAKKRVKRLHMAGKPVREIAKSVRATEALVQTYIDNQLKR